MEEEPHFGVDVVGDLPHATGEARRVGLDEAGGVARVACPAVVEVKVAVPGVVEPQAVARCGADR